MKIVIIILMFLINNQEVRADKIYDMGAIDEVPVSFEKDNISLDYFHELRNSENEVLYLIQPEEPIVTKYSFPVISDDQWAYLKITREQWDRIVVISQLGYGHNDFLDRKWIAITQALIWNTISNKELVIMGNDSLKQDYNNLKSFIDSYYIYPSFIKDDITIKANDNVVFHDFNQVINNYETDADYVTIMDNDVILNFPFEGDYKINFKRSIFNKTKLYSSGSYQDLINNAGSITNEFILNVNVQENPSFEESIDSNTNLEQELSIEEITNNSIIDIEELNYNQLIYEELREKNPDTNDHINIYLAIFVGFGLIIIKKMYKIKLF